VTGVQTCALPIYTSIAANSIDNYNADTMKGWFENMKIVTRDPSGEEEREDEDEEDKNSGEDDAVEGL
jgi:hypothetical protein